MNNSHESYCGFLIKNQRILELLLHEQVIQLRKCVVILSEVR